MSITTENAYALKIFLNQPIDDTMISYLATTMFELLPVLSLADMQITAPRYIPPLKEFISSLAARSNLKVSTLMSSLVYLKRIKSLLPPGVKCSPCAAHRLFLASFNLVFKYLNDYTLENSKWANWSVMRAGSDIFGFSVREVNLMECELLSLLSWNVRITEENLYQEFEIFLNPIKARIRREINYRHITYTVKINPEIYNELTSSIVFFRRMGDSSGIVHAEVLFYYLRKWVPEMSYLLTNFKILCCWINSNNSITYLCPHNGAHSQSLT
ncbi:hypothetical protein RB593_001608 [Gaeumannomyces tritici]